MINNTDLGRIKQKKGDDNITFFLMEKILNIVFMKSLSHF